MAQLRSRVHDVASLNHDRDRRTLLCFPLSCVENMNIRLARVSPPFKYTIHLINAAVTSEAWIYLVSYQEHMRVIACDEPTGGSLLREPPKTATSPTGWENLLAFGTTRATVDYRNLSRCPLCQAPHVRLPLGVEGTLAGRAMILNDNQLRGFQVKKPWTMELTESEGAEALASWEYEDGTPALGDPPPLNPAACEALDSLFWPFRLRTPRLITPCGKQ